MGFPFRMHYHEEDEEGNKAKSTGDTYDNAADAIKEGVDYVKYIKDADPHVKVELDIETIDDKKKKR